MTVSIETLPGSLRELTEQGSKRGWISYEELNTVLPDAFVDPDRLDELLVLFRANGIRMIDEPERRRHRWKSFYAPLETDLKFQRDDPKRPARAPRMQMLEDEEAVREQALAEPNVARHVGDAPLRRVIFVPGRLLNLVL